MVAEIKDEIKRAFGTTKLLGFGSANFLQVDDIFVLEQLKNLNLPQRRDRKAFLFIFHQDFFESDQRAGFFVSRLEHLAEGALTDFREFLILDANVVAKGIIQ